MKKHLNYIVMLVALLTMSVTFIACSSDDDEENNPIVGIWTRPYNDFPDTKLTLNANGTSNYYVHGSGLTGKGTYTYDASTRTLSMFYNPKNSWGNLVWLVLTLDDTHLVAMNTSNGDTYTFTKKLR